MLRMVRNIARNTYALQVLCESNLKSTVATSRLGALWWVVDPLVMMGIYYFMVRVIFERGGEGYHLFALCGIVMWQFFTKTLRLCSNCLKQNSGLMRQVSVPVEIYALVPLLVQLLFAAIGVAIIAVWRHDALGAHTLAVIPLMLAAGVFAQAIGTFFAVFQAYLPDMEKFVDYGLRAGFFLTPILYPAKRVLESDRIPEGFKVLFMCNPMATVISSMREVLLEGRMYDVHQALLLSGAALILLQASLWTLRAQFARIVKRI